MSILKDNCQRCSKRKSRWQRYTGPTCIRAAHWKGPDIGKFLYFWQFLQPLNKFQSVTLHISSQNQANLSCGEYLMSANMRRVKASKQAELICNDKDMIESTEMEMFLLHRRGGGVGCLDQRKGSFAVVQKRGCWTLWAVIESFEFWVFAVLSFEFWVFAVVQKSGCRTLRAVIESNHHQWPWPCFCQEMSLPLCSLCTSAFMS